MLSIHDVSYHIPNAKLSVPESYEYFGITLQQARVYNKIYGLEKIPISMVSTAELLKKPIKNLLDKYGNSLLREVKYIIHAHTSAVVAPFGESAVRQVKNDLGFCFASAFGTTMNKCNSVFRSFELAEQLLADCESNSKAIILAGEVAFAPDVRVMDGVALIGDASAAALVGVNGKKNKLKAMTINIEGKYAKGIWLSKDDFNDLHVSTPKLLANVIEETIEKAGITKEQIKVLIPHNVNVSLWRSNAKRMEIPIEKIYLANIRKYSHCFGADLLIGYADVLVNNMLKDGDYFMMASIGGGANFAAAIFEH